MVSCLWSIIALAIAVKESVGAQPRFGKSCMDLYADYANKLAEKPEDATADFEHFEATEVSQTARQDVRMDEVMRFIHDRA